MTYVLVGLGGFTLGALVALLFAFAVFHFEIKQEKRRGGMLSFEGARLARSYGREQRNQGGP